MVMKLQTFMIKKLLSLTLLDNTCLAVLSLDSVFNKDGNYYPQVFLKESKYIEKKVIRHIIDDLESCFDCFDEELINAIEDNRF